MTKLHKFFEYAYLFIAIIFIVETVLHWNTQREKAYLFLGFSALAVFMFFFKRKFRNKYNNRK